MAAYPKDRIRDRPNCLRQIAGVVKLDYLLKVVESYAAETEGYTRSKVCFSDNWFTMHRWEKGRELRRPGGDEDIRPDEPAGMRMWVWVKKVPGHIARRFARHHIAARRKPKQPSATQGRALAKIDRALKDVAAHGVPESKPRGRRGRYDPKLVRARLDAV
ncbi:MAG: hypothetical protein OXI87_05160 [Albidovulum sp.]|nr:hypothetical protein [Albidovulum sp.]MDE0531547.1 hypothetical protein [Albidovulum sp.]